MTNVLLDTHCHLDAFPDPSQILADAAEADVQLVAVTNSPDDYRRMATLLPRSSPARAALGLHPLQAHRLGMGGVLRFSRHAASAAWIGEIGLDFSPAGRDTRNAQLKVFDALLALPQLRDRPVTVHTRGADRIAVQRLAAAGIRAVLHWYTGPLGVADDALAAGLCFSINPAMVASAKGRTLLARLPHDRVLCETDGPYTRRAGRPSQPADLPALVEDLARLWNVSPTQVRTQICANQRRIVGDPLS
ncbi:TatD family hydrolase [Micromonospora sp. NPDC047707]|uniref:TatD family hydrolase n=1 Tax=Micromonospora sp. NPDC047707 TaxID=3154498 RepID=UPI0034527E07